MLGQGLVIRSGFPLPVILASYPGGVGGAWVRYEDTVMLVSYPGGVGGAWVQYEATVILTTLLIFSLTW